MPRNGQEAEQQLLGPSSSRVAALAEDPRDVQEVEGVFSWVTGMRFCDERK